MPASRPGVIPRTGLVERLMASESPLVAVIAPAGYGKTTLLAEWAERDPRPVAWISVDDGDDDPAVLLGHLALALDTIGDLGPEVFASLRTSQVSLQRTAVPRIGEALRELGRPVLIVMDDVHVLSDPESVELIVLIAERLQPGSQLAFSARGEPGLPLARVRASRELFEVGLDDLALTPQEAARLIAAAGVEISDEDAVLLRDRTEGWPAGLYLAALSLEAQRDVHAAVGRFDGQDRLIVDYLRDELLGHLPPSTVRFLTRTSVLRRMHGPLCDAVLEQNGSTSLLEELERSNRLVIPLDRERRWYRYQEPLRAMLLAELGSREPELETELHRRAVDWYEADGRLEDAIHHAHGARDPLRAARYVAQLTVPLILEGRVGTVRRELGRFDEQVFEDYPPLALATAWTHAFSADPQALHWLRRLEVAAFEGPLPDGTTSLESGVAFLRAALCADGVDSMIADAATVLELEPEGNPMRANAELLLGTGLVLTGVADAGVAMLRDVVDQKDLVKPAVRVVALTELAIGAVDRGAWSEAASHVTECRRLTDADHLFDVAPLAAFAVSALVSAHSGDVDRATEEVRLALRRREESTYVIPWLALQGRLCLTRTFLSLADPVNAREAFEDARAILLLRPNLGVLVERADEVGSLLQRWGAEQALGPSTLTASELRLLPYLPTHLSFREVAERIFVSTNTVKTQVMSIYRKLRVSSRADAVMRAHELGLLAPPSADP